jgi:hypothetical protein
LALVLIGPLLGWWGARQPAGNRLEVHAKRGRNPKNIASGDNKSTPEAKTYAGTLGEYTRPAPGASVEVLPEQER